jgi:hypothetical protein
MSDHASGHPIEAITKLRIVLATHTISGTIQGFSDFLIYFSKYGENR